MKKLLLFLFSIMVMSSFVFASDVAYYNCNDNINNQFQGFFNGSSAGGFSYSATYPSFNISGNGSTKSCDFDGVNGKMEITSTMTFPNSWTISYWVNNDLLGGGTQAHVNKNAAGLNNDITIYTTNTGQMNFIVDDGTSSYIIQYASGMGNGAWHHVVVRYNHVNDTLSIFQDAQFKGSDQCTLNCGIISTGQGWDIAQDRDSVWLNGQLDELKFFNTSLTKTQIQSLYNYGNKTAPAPSADNFSISVSSQYSASNINNVSVNITGVGVFTNTTGNYIVTGLLQNDSSLYNMTVSSPGWFSKTYNDVNISSNLGATLYQSEIKIEIYKEFEGNIISNYNITVDGNTYTVTGNISESIFFDKDNYTITSVVDNTGVETYSVVDNSFEVLSLDNKTVNGSVAGHLINIFAQTINGSTINNFTASIVAFNFTDNRSNTTTTGLASFRVNDGSFNISVNAPGYALANNSQIVVINNSQEIWNYTFTLRTTNSINFTFYSEDTPTVLLTGINITFAIFDGGATNYSTEIGYRYIDLLTPVDYEVRYDANGYDPRSFFFTVTDRSTQVLKLYLANSSLTTAYLIQVRDLTENNVPSVKVSLQRQYASMNGSFVTVEECETNDDGECQMFINDDASIVYRFIIVQDGSIIKTTNPTPIFTLTDVSKIIKIRVDIGANLVEPLQSQLNILGSMNINNNTQIVNFTFVDGNNAITKGCIDVYRRNIPGSYTLFNQSCVNGFNGFITYNYANNLLNDTGLLFEGRIYYSDDSSELLDSVYDERLSLPGSNRDTNDDFLLMAILFSFISFAVLLIPNIIVQLIADFGIMIGAYIVGYSVVGIPIVMFFMVLGIIIFWDRSNNRGQKF